MAKKKKETSLDELEKDIVEVEEEVEEIDEFSLDEEIGIELHPMVKKVSSELFKNKHYAEAVFETVKALNNYVKEKANITNSDLSKAMVKAFNEKQPIIKLNNLKSKSPCKFAQ